MKSKLAKHILMLLTAGVLVNGCGEENKEVRLALKFSPDKIYHFAYENKSSAVARENGRFLYSNDITNKVRYTQEVVESIDSTRARIHYTYTSIKENVLKEDSTRIDTTEETWSTDYVTASNGKIVEVLPLGDVSQESIDYFTKLFEQTSPMFPEEPVPVGYTWSHTVKVMLDEGATDASTTYKVKSLVREAGYDCAVIEYTGNMLVPYRQKCDESGTGYITGSDRIEADGVVYFAYTEGIIIKEYENSTLLREGTLIRDEKKVSFTVDSKTSYTCRLTEIEPK
ncbi:MAG: hypothetical protein JSU69_04465 [Candidatus Zixiibacteriota bacterium]|nr:MAG: hypothetical protein JSU69_04465 [candidate division Zixibacteria bacterium]